MLFLLLKSWFPQKKLQLKHLLTAKMNCFVRPVLTWQPRASAQSAALFVQLVTHPANVYLLRRDLLNLNL